MNAPAIGVCGFGRCGSTMVMAMLHAGGVEPVAGSSPGSYEVQDLAAIRRMDAAMLVGRSVKLLDEPLRSELPPAESWRFVWMDRDPEQQARSTVKFVEAMVGPLDHRPHWPAPWKRLAASYGADRAKALGLLRAAGPVVVLRYEQVLANPQRAARSLAAVCPDFDRRAAAAVVHDRDGACRPDLAVELAISGAAS